MNPPNISEQYLLNKRIEMGAKLKAIRTSKGLTIESVAEASGIDKHHLNRIEAGKYNLNINLLILICEALDLDIAFVKK